MSRIKFLHDSLKEEDEEEEEEEGKRLPEAPPLYSLLSSARRSGRSAKKNPSLSLSLSLSFSLCRSSVRKRRGRGREPSLPLDRGLKKEVRKRVSREFPSRFI